MRRHTRGLDTAYAATALIDSVLAGRSDRRARRLRSVTKPLLMPLLLARTRAATRGRLGRATATAQAFSWGGDVALLGRGDPAFLTGVGSFAVAHACYIAGFAGARDPRATTREAGPRTGAAVFVVLAPVMAIAAGRRDPHLRVPIAAYAGVLASMFATSTVLDEVLPSTARRRIVTGTALFLVSDGLLGVQRFLRTTPSPGLESAVMATYTAGQWLIADGVARAVPADAPG